MGEQGIRRKVIHEFVAGLRAARERFDAKTGRFLTDGGGWAVTHQDIILPIAALYALPESPMAGDAELLDLASRGGDALRDWQDADGRFEFIKPDGSTWGKTYMCWSIYHWVETYQLLRDALAPDRAARWEEGLRLCYDGLAAEFADPDHRLHNIPCWNGMSLVRAGRIFGEQKWEDVGRAVVGRHIDVQTPHGYWNEHGGPTTSYNSIYLHPIGLYYRFTGDPAALRALERGLDFHLHFTYPDGSGVETVDGRVRHHPRPMISLTAGALQLPKGRRLLGRIIDGCAGHESAGGLSPYLAQVLLGNEDDSTEAIPVEQARFASVFADQAVVRREGAWFSCLSGFVTPDEHIVRNSRVRWALDRQSLLSVFHDALGVVIGGGNSKHAPEFSSFEVTSGRVRRIVPDAATVASADNVDTLTLTYGEVECELSVRTDDDALEIAFAVNRAAAADTITGGFTLPALAGRTVVAPDGREQTLEVKNETALWLTGPGESGRMTIGRLAIDLPADCGLHHPLYAYDPYRLEGIVEDAKVVGGMSFPVRAGEPPRTFRLTVLDE